MDYEGNYYKHQLIRSSGAYALNFGEVQGTQTDRDFNHKNGIVIKELIESRVSLKVLTYIQYGEPSKRKELLTECEEIIRICYSRRKK